MKSLIDKFKAILVSVVLLCTFLSLGGCFTTDVSSTSVATTSNTADTGTFSQSATPTLSMEQPIGKLAFVFGCCECTKTDLALLTLPGKDINFIQAGQQNIRQPAWSLDGRMMGMLLYGDDERILRIINLPTQEVHSELPGSILEFAWSADSESIFYLNKEELYQYELNKGESSFLVDGVSHFSVSPSGQWLGLSKRESDQTSPYFNNFTFRVLNLMDSKLLTIPDRDDVEKLGSNRSVWSPVVNEVAVIFGTTSAQSSKIVIYGVQEDGLHIRHSVIARDTYQQDYGQSEVVDFSDIVWSPDGQNLLTSRSISEGEGEALLFDNELSSYERLPLGEGANLFAWMPSGKWLAYTTASNTTQEGSACINPLRGDLHLTNMETLETQVLVTETLRIERPVWRP